MPSQRFLEQQAEFEQRTRYAPPRLGQPRRPSRLDEAEEDSGGFIAGLKDVAVAPFRGALNAAQDVVGLLDAVTPGELLHEPENNPWGGHASTTIGGLVEGISNFAVGFIPVAGWLGKGAKLGKTLQLARGLSEAAELTRFAKGAKVAATATKVGRAALAGAIADLAVWDGHEARLSDLIEHYPLLSNPVSEYLASDPDDPEIIGRLKTAVEGVGAGAVFDSLLFGLKQLGAFRKAFKETKDVAKATEIAETAVPNAQIEQALVEGRARSLNVPETEAQVATSRAPVGEAVAMPEDPKVSKSDRVLLKSLGLEKVDVDTVVSEVNERGRLNELFDDNAHVNPRSLTQVELLEKGLKKIDFNLEHWEGSQGSAELVQTIDQLYVNAAVRDKSSTGMARKTAEELDMETLKGLADLSGEKNMQTLLVSTMKSTKDLAEMNAIHRGRKMLLQRKAEDIYSKLQRATDPTLPQGDTARVYNEVLEELRDTVGLQHAVRGYQADLARGLWAERLPVRAIVDPEELLARLEPFKGPEGAREAIENLKSLWGEGGFDGASRLNTAARGMIDPKSGKWFRMLNEYWMFSLLSGGRTAVVNGTAGLTASFYLPLENMLGAATRLAGAKIQGRTADAIIHSQEMGLYGQEFMGLVRGFKDAMAVGWHALKSGEVTLDPLGGVIDTPNVPRREITAEAFNLDPKKGGFGGATGMAINWLGAVTSLPQRIMGSTDAFIKQLNYRAVFEANAIQDFMKRPGATRQQAAEYVADLMAETVLKGQQHTEKNLWLAGRRRAAKELTSRQKDAFADQFVKDHFNPQISAMAAVSLNRAREATFTAPLRKGSLGKRVHDATIAHPALRFVLPFVRTPVNIVNAAAQRIDFISLARDLAGQRWPDKFPHLEESRLRYLREMNSPDTRLRSAAVGRIMAGAGAMATFLSMAQTGRITGRGPSDPEERKILEDAGWLPYSIRYTPADGKDKFYQFSRFEPFSILVGLAADMGDYGRYAAEEDQGSVEKLGWGFVVAAANNFTNKTYLTGLSRFIGALSQPDEKVEGVLNSFAASFVPSALNQSRLAFEQDDTARDVNGFLEGLMERTPGLSNNLAPVRNILGEPVKRTVSAFSSETGGIADFLLPVAYRSVKDELIEKELVALRHGFKPPRKQQVGIDLTQVSKDGQSAYDRWSQLQGEVLIGGRNLRTALKSVIKSRNYQRMSLEATAELESPRVAEINRVIQKYRQRAWDQMTKEYPEIRRLETNRTANKRRLRLGQFPINGA